jgi:hypothetical protein
MTAGPALPCPRCKRVLGPESWADERRGECFRCKSDFEFMAFPALTATRAQVAPQAAVLADDSVCFFHIENRAEAICESCGRLLCPVCAVPFAGQKLCPTCVAATRVSQAPTITRERVLYDGIAMALAVIPLLPVFWFVVPVTSPIALGFVIYGWRKPGSLVRGTKLRLVVAGIFALIGMAAATAVISTVWLRPR